MLLIQNTPWGMSWNAAEDGPRKLRREQSATLPPDQMRAIGDKVGAVMQGQGFAFVYSQYQMYDASMAGWSASPAHDRLMGDINSAPFRALVREVTGRPSSNGPMPRRLYTRRPARNSDDSGKHWS